jgi:PIN domain nuclease of toxin-antitoxin system
VILLDTCALLWLADGTLPAPLLRRIASLEVTVLVSAISAWEVGVKHAAGKLPLPAPPLEWFRGLVAHHSLGEVPVESDIALLSARLPPIHADPADRILIATAMHAGATLLTPDPRIRAYPGVKVRWA